MSCIGWARELDPDLHESYAINLLEPGWAGELDRSEFAYVKSKLKQSLSLRRRWGFRPSAKRLSEARIRAVAMQGVSGHERRVLALAQGSKRRDLIEDAEAPPRAGPSAMKSPLWGAEEARKCRPRHQPKKHRAR